MKSLISVIGLVVSCIGFVSAVEKPETVCETDSCKKTARYLLNTIDQTQDPCKDFYRFACGHLMDKHPLPADATEYGTNDVITNNRLKLLQDILEVKNPSNSRTVQNAQSLYSNCWKQNDDTALLKNEVKKLGGWPVTAPNQQYDDISLESLLANLTLRGTNAVIMAYVDMDYYNSSRFIIQVDYADLSLPPYFTDDDDSNNAYINALISVVETMGAPNSKNTTNQVKDMVLFGNQLADIIPDPDLIINYTKIYKVMTIGQLQQLTDPRTEVFNWLKFYSELLNLELTSDEPVGVFDQDYLVKAVQLIKFTNKITVLNYIMECFVQDYAWHVGGALNKEYASVIDNFNDISDAKLRNTTCTDFTNNVFGYALSKQYVAKVFPPSNIQKVQEITELMRSVYIAGLSNFSAFDAHTRAIAERKIAALTFLVGYPEWIENDQIVEAYYSKFPKMNGGHFTNALNSMISLTKQDLDYLRTEVDKKFFVMSPTTAVGEYYLGANLILLSAALLQGPLYTSGPLQSLDLGVLGSQIGNLMNFAINHIGSQFDENGNLNDWWPANIQDAIMKDTQCIADQFNNYCSPTDSTDCIDGTDNAFNIIGYLVGLVAAEQAHLAWSSKNGPEPQLPGLEKYTSKQVFYIGYAQRICTADIVDILGYDPNIMAQYSVNGILANLQAFAETYQCPLGVMNRGNNSCTLF